MKRKKRYQNWHCEITLRKASGVERYILKKEIVNEDENVYLENEAED